MFAFIFYLIFFILFGQSGRGVDLNDNLALLPGKKNLSCVKNLGGIFDTALRFVRQINAVVKIVSVMDL